MKYVIGFFLLLNCFTDAVAAGFQTPKNEDFTGVLLAMKVRVDNFGGFRCTDPVELSVVDDQVIHESDHVAKKYIFSLVDGVFPDGQTESRIFSLIMGDKSSRQVFYKQEIHLLDEALQKAFGVEDFEKNTTYECTLCLETARGVICKTT